MFTEWKGRRGIDVSEHNGPVDWAAVRAAGMDFAVLRLGYGRRHLDDRFRENLDGAAGAGLALGVYVGAFPPLSLTTEDGKLLLHNGRRPVLTLAPLGVDAFTVEGEPTRRLTFARDGQGRVVAAKLETSDGSVSRFKRGD